MGATKFWCLTKTSQTSFLAGSIRPANRPYGFLATCFIYTLGVVESKSETVP